MRGDEDDRRRGVELQHALQQREAVHLRQAHVADDDADELTADLRERLLGRFIRRHLEARELQRLHEAAAHRAVVVDQCDADCVNHCCPSTLA